MKKILISGAGGFIGSAAAAFFAERGYSVIRLARGRPEPGMAWWNPLTEKIQIEALEGVDVVIHLAGENLASGRWNEAKKLKIKESRVNGTRFLCKSLAALKRKPDLVISASAIGYYGDRGEEWLDETSPPGEGFLAEVCREWELAAEPAARAGIRVVQVRQGVVLSRQGGALARMLPVFRLGLGGRMGSGSQFLSWIALEDVCRAFWHIVAASDLAGAVNLVSPQLVSNLEFTKLLGRALHRPTWFGVPAMAVKLLLGEMAEELLLSSARVRPARLLQTGFEFQYAELGGALEALLQGCETSSPMSLPPINN